ncbi:hypothetical protein M0R45_029507 [Rubus argutus]|uniref:Uncharacterized protein n=1 Tax=Rubus argutus TaxID=59490 RepID=A0AAW1WA83_RUBAR
MKKAEDSSLMKFRLMIIGKLQKGLSLLTARGPHDHDQHLGFDEELEVANLVPEDVKEGHFAVFAVMGSETKRFVTKLESLNDPALLKLLEQDKDEYGFQQKGALEVHCRPEELHKILENFRREKSRFQCICNNNSDILTALGGC